MLYYIYYYSGEKKIQKNIYNQSLKYFIVCQIECTVRFSRGEAQKDTNYNKGLIYNFDAYKIILPAFVQADCHISLH